MALLGSRLYLPSLSIVTAFFSIHINASTSGYEFSTESEEIYHYFSLKVFDINVFSYLFSDLHSELGGSSGQYQWSALGYSRTHGDLSDPINQMNWMTVFLVSALIACAVLPQVVSAAVLGHVYMFLPVFSQTDKALTMLSVLLSAFSMQAILQVYRVSLGALVYLFEKAFGKDAGGHSYSLWSFLSPRIWCFLIIAPAVIFDYHTTAILYSLVGLFSLFNALAQNSSMLIFSLGGSLCRLQLFGSLVRPEKAEEDRNRINVVEASVLAVSNNIGVDIDSAPCIKALGEIGQGMHFDVRSHICL